MGARKKYQDAGEIHCIDLACYHAVRDYPGKVKAVAAVYGWNPATLDKKLNPAESGHRLAAEEAMDILKLTQDRRILDAVVSVGNAVWLPVEQVEVIPGDLDLLECGNNMHVSAAAVVNEFVMSLADGEIDSVERGGIEKKALEMQQSLMAVLETSKQFERGG